MITDEYDRWLEGFEKREIQVASIPTSVRLSPGFSDKKDKTALYLHGISGNFYGMVPLAYELQDTLNAIFVDLPSHGSSGLLNGNSPYQELESWASRLVEALKSDGVVVDEVIAHSFSCNIGVLADVDRVWLINPPFSVRRYTQVLSKLFYLISPLTALVYQLPVLDSLRRRILLKSRDKEVRRVIDWTASFGKASFSQQKSQINLAHDAQYKLSGLLKNSAKQIGVITAKFDNVVNAGPVSVDNIKFSKEIDGGHILVLEEPVAIADIIRNEPL